MRQGKLIAKMDRSVKESSKTLGRTAVDRGLRNFIIEGLLNNIFLNINGTLFASTYLTGFFLKLGADQIQMGIVGAIPRLGVVAKLASSYIVERYQERKWLCFWSSVLSKLAWAVVILLSLSLGPSNRLTWVFLTLIMISTMSYAVSFNGWVSWVAELVPAKIRGLYFSRRNTLITLGVMVSGLLAGLYIDRYKEVSGYLLVFGITSAIGIVSSLLLIGVPEPKMTSRVGVDNFARNIRTALRSMRFRNYLIMNAIITFAFNVKSPFLTIFMLENLKISFSRIALLGIVSSFLSMATMRIWGILADRVGNRSIQAISMASGVIMASLWIFNTPDNYIPLIASYFVQGALWSAYDITNFNLLLNLTPKEGRSLYEAITSVVNGLAGTIAPILSGIALQRMGDFTFSLFGVPIVGLQMTVIVSAIARLISLYFLTKIPSPNEMTVGSFLKRSFASNPFQVYWNILRYSTSLPEEKRIKIISSLGRTKSPVATGTLTEALQDPSPVVRREAAVALSSIDHGRTAKLLGGKISDLGGEFRGGDGALPDESTTTSDGPS